MRKSVLSLHIAVSGGWLGAALAYIVLDVIATSGMDGQRLLAAYAGMELIASFALLPLAVASLVSGVLISLMTPWGLFRHWWTLISLLLTTVAAAVLAVEMGTIQALATAALAADEESLRSLGGTLPHSLGGAGLLLLILTLNVFKPSGLTPYGWRTRRQ